MKIWAFKKKTVLLSKLEYLLRFFYYQQQQSKNHA